MHSAETVGSQIPFEMDKPGKTTHLRIYMALLLSLFFFLAGGLRSEDVGHDFIAYAEQVNKYYGTGESLFPDLVFHSISAIMTTTIDVYRLDRAFTTRGFMLTIAMLQAFLLFKILRSKRPADMLLLAVGFSPLIFMDIIRQGLAMLLAGVYFGSRQRENPLYLLLAFGTHVATVVSIAALRPRKIPPTVIAGLGFLVLIIGWLLIDGLEARYLWYSSQQGYLLFDSLLGLLPPQLSVLNAITLAFFAWAALSGFLSRKEGVVLIVLYIIGIILPLFFRTFLFYLFLVCCSRDIFIRKYSIQAMTFNIGFAILVLRMVALAFVAPEA